MIPPITVLPLLVTLRPAKTWNFKLPLMAHGEHSYRRYYTKKASLFQCVFVGMYTLMFALKELQYVPKRWPNYGMICRSSTQTLFYCWAPALCVQLESTTAYPITGELSSPVPFLGLSAWPPTIQGMLYECMSMSPLYASTSTDSKKSPQLKRLYTLTDN